MKDASGREGRRGRGRLTSLTEGSETGEAKFCCVGAFPGGQAGGSGPGGVEGLSETIQQQEYFKRLFRNRA